MELTKEIFDFLSLFIGIGAIGLYVLFSKQICDKKLSSQELKCQREIDKLTSEKNEIESKYNSIKNSHEKLLEGSTSDICNFAASKELRAKYKDDKIVNTLFNTLLKDYVRKSRVILEDSKATFEQKYDILNSLEKIEDIDIFDSSLIKSLVIALVDSERYLEQEKLVFLLKKINKPLTVNNAIIDYYPWAGHDSIPFLIKLLGETWDDINLNRLDGLVKSLNNREEKVLQPLKDFRNKLNNNQ